ncbi:MAG: general stress protein [Nocardioides sp.]|uniref:general stress protein n=1 Tax=Nocardioides sp. TaxID=35761 RepID=UPI003F08F3B6
MAKIFQLEYPQSLGVFDEYADAQRAVDLLADHDFPVNEVLIVGTDLKQVERVTGRLSWGTVLLSGAAGGAWMGLLVGLLLGLFVPRGDWLSMVVAAVGFGAVWGAVFSAVRYAATKGERDFASIKAVLPSRYEVLVEHKHLARGQELLSGSRSTEL